MRAPGCKCGMMRSSAWPCSETRAQSCCAQPSRAAARLKAEGAGRQIISSTRHMRHQRRADAVEEGVARGEHHDLAPAPRQDRRESIGERRGPGERLAGKAARKRKMPLSAHHELGVGDEPLRGGREAVGAVLPDADEREPGRHRALRPEGRAPRERKSAEERGRRRRIGAGSMRLAEMAPCIVDREHA